MMFEIEPDSELNLGAGIISCSRDRNRSCPNFHALSPANSEPACQRINSNWEFVSRREKGECYGHYEKNPVSFLETLGQLLT